MTKWLHGDTVPCGPGQPFHRNQHLCGVFWCRGSSEPIGEELLEKLRFPKTLNPTANLKSLIKKALCPCPCQEGWNERTFKTLLTQTVYGCKKLEKQSNGKFHQKKSHKLCSHLYFSTSLFYQKGYKVASVLILQSKQDLTSEERT